jgi:hypothetical protein
MLVAKPSLLAQFPRGILPGETSSYEPAPLTHRPRRKPCAIETVNEKPIGNAAPALRPEPGTFQRGRGRSCKGGRGNSYVIKTARPFAKIAGSSGEIRGFYARAAPNCARARPRPCFRAPPPSHHANGLRRCFPRARSRSFDKLRPPAVNGRDWRGAGRGPVAQGYGHPAPPDIAAVSTFTKWRENTETMLATLAAKADMQDQRIAALEASQADRRAYGLEVAGAIVGLFNYAIHGLVNPRVAPPKTPTRPGER